MDSGESKAVAWTRVASQGGKKEQRTWFWMRSLIRSMGAAAVFETAAETPPTSN